MEIVPIDTMGGRETNTLYLNDCEAPGRERSRRGRPRLDPADGGPQRRAADPRRDQLGIAERAFDDALAYVKERKQFGRPIGSFQALQHRLADLATELEAAKLMTYWVASMVDEDQERMLPKEASMVKLYVTELAKKVTLEGMQMMGGYGYSSEYDMERLVRTTLVSTIYGGTSEIQRDDHRQDARALRRPGSGSAVPAGKPDEGPPGRLRLARRLEHSRPVDPLAGPEILKREPDDAGETQALAALRRHREGLAQIGGL